MIYCLFHFCTYEIIISLFSLFTGYKFNCLTTRRWLCLSLPVGGTRLDIFHTKVLYFCLPQLSLFSSLAHRYVPFKVDHSLYCPDQSHYSPRFSVRFDFPWAPTLGPRATLGNVLTSLTSSPLALFGS